MPYSTLLRKATIALLLLPACSPCNLSSETLHEGQNAAFLSLLNAIYENRGILSVSTLPIVLLLVGLFIYQHRRYKRESERRVEAQRKLQEEKAYLSFALESGNIFTFRLRDDMFEFDKKFYRALGLPSGLMSIKQFEQTIYPKDRTNYIKNLEQLNAGLEAPRIVQQRHNFDGNGYEWWEFRYARREERKTSCSGEMTITGLCLNVQEVKNTERNLILARRKAEESDRMKSVFLANMSHEIRTPLNAIVGFSQLLNSDVEIEQDEKMRFLQLISTNSDLLLKLINDILDLSLMDSGGMSLNIETLNLSRLLTDISFTHQVMMPQGVKLQTQLPDPPIILQTDRLRLTQVCTNFINNAKKFTTKGYIRIGYRLSADEKYTLIYVSDTGIGIPEDKKDMIFGRFQKLNEFAQGTGLGLSICRSIAQALEGYVSVDSIEGKGSTFTIALPNQIL